MTSPKYAAQVPGKGRWYTHPETGETWPSITNILDVAVSKPALVPWAAKVTATKAWDELPRMVALSRSRQVCSPKRAADRCGKCRDCLDREIKGEHKFAKDVAADLGSRVHALAEAYVLGKPTAADAEAEPFVEQLLRFYVDWGVNLETDIEAAECTVINRRHGYAGTGDVFMWLPVGPGGARRLLVVDYKTSSTRPVTSVYPEHGMQTAALAKAETVLLDDGTEIPMPKPITGTAILNLRADSYALVPMPLAGTVTDAFVAFCGALKTATYLHSCYGVKPQPIEPPTTEKGEAA
jgi:hypothetical protein